MAALREEEAALEYEIHEKLSSTITAGESESKGVVNTILMCVKEMILIETRPSVGAQVDCWDKDHDFDDKMCEGITGEDGCVYMTYKEQSWDWFGEYPDIYCSVNKRGFSMSVPPDRDNHNPAKQAEFSTTLYRDRSRDHGHVNGCGPQVTEAINHIPTMLTTFEQHCFDHDKCYYDCNILEAFNNDKDKAQKFCDDEMLEGMKSSCYYRHGNTYFGVEETCLGAANSIHLLLTTVPGAYYNDCATNPVYNDYTDNHFCSPDGHKCGYDGTTSDELAECAYCCNEGFAIDEGYTWDDHYCTCFPRGFKCGSTLFTNKFNVCDQCCNGNRKDSGWSYSDYYCT